MRKFNCSDGMQYSIFKSRKCYAADCTLSSIYAFGCSRNSDFHAPTSTPSSPYVSSLEIAFDNGGSSNNTSHPSAFHPEARYPQAAFFALIFFIEVINCQQLILFSTGLLFWNQWDFAVTISMLYIMKIPFFPCCLLFPFNVAVW